jgi:6-phosphogluconolactonase
MSRARLSAWAALAIGFVSLRSPVKAEFVYVVNGGGSDNVSAYRIGSDGALRPVPGSPFAAGIGPFAVFAEPAGKYVYVVNEGENDVSAYRIGDDGALEPLPRSPFTAGLSPFSVAVSAKSNFAYVANRFGENVSAYRIGPEGTLIPIGGSPFAAGAQPCCVVVGKSAPGGQ